MMQTPRTPFTVLVVAAALAAGCAAPRVPDPEMVDPPPVPEEVEPVEEPEAVEAPAVIEPEAPALPDERPAGFTADSLYRLLVAELAGQRGDFDLALQGYLETARESRDPRVAERATRTAIYLGAMEQALEGAHRWAELEPDSRDAHSILARIYLHRGDVDNGLYYLQRVIQSTPGGTEPGLREVAALVGQAEDVAVAREVVEVLAQDYPASAELQYSRATLARRSGDTDVALGAVNRALEIDPAFGEAVTLKARLLGEAGRTGEAVTLLREARERDPASRDLALGHVQLLIDIDARDQAVVEMQHVFEAFGDDAHTVHTLSLLAMQVGAWDDARIYLKRLLAMDTRSDTAHYYLGRIAQQEGRCDEAIRHYINVADEEQRFDAQLRAALCMAELGQVAEARLHLDRLARAHVQPDALNRIAVARAQIERNAGNSQEALRVLSLAVDRDPDDMDLRYSRALAAAALDRFELARSDLELMLERDPDDPAVQNALGYTLADNNVDLDRAKRLIQSALDERPDDAAIIDSMGWVLFRLGEYERALEYLRDAWERMPDAEVGAHLGEVLWALQRRDEARRIWEAAAEVDPDHRVLRETIERLTR